MRTDSSTPIRVRPVPNLEQLPGDLHPVLRRVLAARRVGPGEMRPSLSQLIPVGSLPGIGPAVERLVAARRRGEPVLVLGDFDADGATATALMLTCLRGFGYSGPGFLVPDRLRFGYGLTPGIAELAAQGRPDLLITVDNGITSLDGVARARELGMDVVVTDHHLAGTHLPATPWIVNPNLPGATFGSPALSGVGVAFYVMAALGRELAAAGLLEAAAARSMVTDCLDLVATGTVADLVPLDFNNRILVAEGLRRLRTGRSRPGIRALFSVAGRDPAAARAADLGFAVGPRLNAAGRLTDMTVGINCLLATDQALALAIARQLDDLNRERRELQDRMEAEAASLLAGLDRVADGGEAAVCLFDPGWHPGVVGLVASRIRERTGRPAVAFAPAGEAGWLRGSARSVDGIHIRDAIDAAARQLPPGTVKFGGHAMAAGVSLPEASLEDFRAAFAMAVAAHRSLLEAPDTLWTDGPLEARDLDLELAEQLAAAGPWGQAFPEPVFDNELLVLEQRVVGQRHLRLKLRHPEGNRLLDAIAFGREPLAGLAAGGAIRCVYRLDVNVFRDARSAQLVVEHLECD